MKDKDEEEIPIWICGEPRFISGIANRTTCNDVIRALIEDEVRYIDNTDDAIYVSRDFRDYVITEKWRDIEQALPGDTFILPIWSEWGVAQNEVNFKLKINKMKAEVSRCTNNEDTKVERPYKEKKKSAISKLIQRVIKQGEAIHNQLSNYRLNSSFSHRSSRRYENRRKSQTSTLPRNCHLQPPTYLDSPKTDDNHTDDEILIVLHPNDDDKDSGINIHPGLSKDIRIEPELDSISEIFAAHGLNDTLRFPYPNLNRLAKHEFVSSTPHSTSRRRKSLQFNIIRNEIVETTQGIEDLLQHEKYLTKHLTRKRDKYRAQNELYRTKAGPDVCIDEIQENLATYGKQIVEHELDLYKIKKEIQRKCAVLNNLKRMVIGEDAANYRSLRYGKSDRRVASRRSGLQRKNLEFVDNIFEFCDNNESIIV
ncbi:uncharacterized protein LOC119648691 isoform X2 [Hermetia illucens]|nr:uncharacterized protein LOC119648691 isoform X2 [Hermetia illucens]XP_037906423.1 uncharacterized protein LOC119648691 isoform X2 [Hermetia illucens]